MANITTPEVVPSTTNHNGIGPLLEQHLERVCRDVDESDILADQAKQDILKDIAREESHDERPDDDELPPVYQFPIVRVIQTQFYNAGRHPPLPFPDTDD